jgi:hypothetical protein
MEIDLKCDKIISDINDAVAEYKSRNARDPEYLVLSIMQRQVIKLQAAIGLGAGLWELPDPVEYLGIPIIDKESVVMP